MPQPAGAQTPGRTVVRGGHVLNVFTGELLPQDIMIEAGRIAALAPPQEAGEAATVIDAHDRVVVPGYVEPHAHLGLVAEPVSTLEQWAAHGTTAVVADTYPWLALLADEGFVAMLDRFQQLPVYVRWMLVPHGRGFAPGEEETYRLERLDRFLAREDVVALGEITRWSWVEQGEPDLAAKIARARALGKRIEGHSAGASPARVMRLAQRGFTSCHEAIDAAQVMARLRAGLYVMLRHSSLRPDLPALLEAVRGDVVHSNRLMLTADGPTPPWVAEHGYLDHLIRIALESGVPPAAAYRMATLNPAMYYRLEDDVGSVAPGRRADLLILESLANPTPLVVIAGGKVVAEGGRLATPFPRLDWAGLLAHGRLGARTGGRPPTAATFAQLPGPGEAGSPVLELTHTVIVRRAAAAERPLLAVLYDWEGRWLTHAWLTGLADELAGLASSYNPSHQLLVLGSSPSDMALAAQRVMELGGGMAMAERGRVLWELALERGGIFTERPWPELVDGLRRMEALLRERGYRFGDPLYSLFFLSFDALPDFRLTIRGVWDVKAGRAVVPPRPLP